MIATELLENQGLPSNEIQLKLHRKLSVLQKPVKMESLNGQIFKLNSSGKSYHSLNTIPSTEPNISIRVDDNGT